VLRTLLLCLCAGLELVLMCSGRASALPVFAHRYGFSCQQCHTTIPQLNAFGEYFQRNGFRLSTEDRGVAPISVKVNVQYQSTGDPGLPKAVVDEVELLSGGSLGRNTSYFVEQYAIDGGVPGRPRDAWVLFDKPTSGDDRARTTLHARIGEFTLPLPVDPETERPTLNHYALYDQTVGSNGFNFFDPRVGSDLFVTNYARGVEAHLVLAQAYDRASGVPRSGVDTMATFAKTFDERWTATLYHYQGQRRLTPMMDRFFRNGFALQYDRERWNLVGSLQRGFDTSSNGLGLGTTSSGGYLSADYTFTPALQLVARYDDIFNEIDGRSRDTTLSLVMRPRRNMRFTLEGVRTGSTTQFGTALLFAY
jgi:hypothetical protein